MYPSKGILLLRFVCLVCLVLLLCFAGCHHHRVTRLQHVSREPGMEKFRLTSLQSLEPTEQTRLTLRSHALEPELKRDPLEVLAELKTNIDKEASPDLLFAFSELAYQYGTLREPENARFALELYVASATFAYRYLFDTRFDTTRNPYDPQFREICGLYNRSLEKIIRLVSADGNISLAPGNDYAVNGLKDTWNIRCELRTGTWTADEIDSYKFTHDYEVYGLQNEYRQYGLGVPLIAERKKNLFNTAASRYYPHNLTFPITVFLRPVFKSAEDSAEPLESDSEGGGELHAVLEFYDPLVSSYAMIGNRHVPLETDLTTPLAYMLSDPRLPAWGVIGFLRPEVFLSPLFAENERPREKISRIVESPDIQQVAYRNEAYSEPDKSRSIEGIYMVQPYEKGKIPVVFVHGLWSTPMTWMEMFNTLRSIPEIRSKYQFWFYFYPTAEPFWVSAAKFRADLAEVREVLDPGHAEESLDRMVLVGHSMGGLLSMMQTVESEGRFWGLISDSPMEQTRIDGKKYDKDDIGNWFFFEPNPSIRRVVTIATPHRGSDFANGFTQWLARSAIRIPRSLKEGIDSFMSENDDVIGDKSLLKVKTSVDSLAKGSPFFDVLLHTRHAPWTEYNNIVGIYDSGKLAERLLGVGDGVVSLESARLENVESEEIVQEVHSSVHMHPKAIMEVRRILLHHLEAMQAEDIPPYVPVGF